MRREKRQFKREKYRLSCEFRHEGRSHSGIVGDIAARGLFVNSSVKPAEGAEIELTMRDPSLGEIVVRGHVARLQRTHRSVAVVTPAGFGLMVDHAPEAFFQLLIKLGLD